MYNWNVYNTTFTAFSKGVSWSTRFALFSNLLTSQDLYATFYWQAKWQMAASANWGCHTPHHTPHTPSRPCSRVLWNFRKGIPKTVAWDHLPMAKHLDLFQLIASPFSNFLVRRRGLFFTVDQLRKAVLEWGEVLMIDWQCSSIQLIFWKKWVSLVLTKLIRYCLMCVHNAIHRVTSLHRNTFVDKETSHKSG